MPPLMQVPFEESGSLYNGFSKQRLVPSLKSSLAEEWNSIKSSSLYKVDSWGAPYFAVSATGAMVVRPHGHETKLNEEIDIFKVVQKVTKPRIKGGLGLSTPIILRFPEVLRDRLQRLQSSFEGAIKAEGYKGCYQGVYPVKCNQDRYVVENIVEFGKPFGFGLEAGSKPELLLAMASLCKGSPHALLICNGYKDTEYISLALLAREIGLNCVIVLEQEEELDLVLNISKKLSINPVIGLRARLNTKHGGHFGDTSGEKGKFGLSSTEIIQIVKKLQCANKLACLQLLHFHIGSQIPCLTVLNDGVSEAAYIYCELALMGAGMKYIDIGGGLGIDYDGTNSTHSDLSVGYTMEEYALEVVQAVNNACTLKGVKQPTLCSESGRALVSHHSVLVFNVFSSNVKSTNMEKGVPLEVEGLPQELKVIQNSFSSCSKAQDYEGAFKLAKVLKDKCTEIFKQGRLGLMQLAAVNSLYDTVFASMEKTRCGSKNHSANFAHKPGIDSSFDDEEGSIGMASYSAIYHINLSIFRSMPDTWAIEQLFPIVPIHRLDKEPNVRAKLCDLTCDSDGKVASFIGKDKKGRRLNYLNVHELEDGKPYYMGMFLGGAYQEALGSLHNLFGAPAVLTVNKSGMTKNGPKVSKTSNGQTVSDVLKLMQYEPFDMIETLKVYMQKTSYGLDIDHDLHEDVMKHVVCTFTSPTYLTTNNSVVKSRILAVHNAPSIFRASPPLQEELANYYM